MNPQAAEQRTEASGKDPPPHAFVVEDDVLTLRLLSELAASYGLEPMLFTRLSTARRALRKHVPAVMVVDDDLPDGQGADLVREVRASPRTRHVRILFCTAAPPSRRREMSRLAPVVEKPFDLAAVEEALAELARR